MSKLAEEITQVEFAKLIGVSKQRINEAVKKGLLVLEPSGKLNKIKSLARWRKYLDPSKYRDHYKKPNPQTQESKPEPNSKQDNTDKPPQPEPEPTAKPKRKTKNLEKEFNKKINDLLKDSEIEDYNDAKFRKEKYNAMYRKLEYEEKLGTLVSKDEVKQKYFTIIRNFRDEIMTIPTRLSASFSSHIVEFIRDKMAGDFTEQQIETLLKKISVNEIEHVAFTDWKRESENALNELEKLRK